MEENFLVFIPIITIITILIIYYHYHHYHHHYQKMPRSEDLQSYIALFGVPPSQVGAESRLTQADIRELSQPRQYLSDNVIGAIIHLFRYEYNFPGVVVLDPLFLSRLESFDRGYQDQAQYLANTTYLEENGTPYEFLIMPLNIFDDHWVLAVLHRPSRTWTVLDSLYGTGTAPNTHNRVKRLVDKLLYKWWGNPRDPRWTYQQGHCSKQTDGSNCAIHVIENIRHLQKYERPDLTPINGYALRQAYLNSIRTKGQHLMSQW
jgi:Ulp1 family protease